MCINEYFKQLPICCSLTSGWILRPNEFQRKRSLFKTNIILYFFNTSVKLTSRYVEFKFWRIEKNKFYDYHISIYFFAVCKQQSWNLRRLVFNGLWNKKHFKTNYNINCMFCLCYKIISVKATRNNKQASTLQKLITVE